VRVRRVYFAHPIVLYDSALKRDVVDLIRDRFGNVEVVDPARFDDVSHGVMNFYFMLVDSSDVVFMPFLVLLMLVFLRRCISFIECTGGLRLIGIYVVSFVI